MINGGETLVQFSDRLRVAPRLQVESEPAHILEVRRHLLAIRKCERVGADAAGLIDVALANVRRGQGGQQTRPRLDYLRVEVPSAASRTC